MDDLLSEFLTETNESLDTVDNELVRFEQDPNNAKILGNIFRLVHTIKGTCGFIGLPRLESLTHAAETLMGKFRDGVPVTTEAVSLILVTLDRIKEVMAGLEAKHHEPEGSDQDLIDRLNAMVLRSVAAAEACDPAPSDSLVEDASEPEPERVLRLGEVSLDELERAFQETVTDCEPPAAGPAPDVKPVAIEPKLPAVAIEAKLPAEAKIADNDRVANQSIRVNVDTLEHLMTMVSELVLTRNQLLELNRRSEDSDIKVSLQRLSNVTAELQDGVMKTRMQPIGHAWQKLPRIIRDLNSELGKQIELELHGAETELDRQVLDLIKDPLTHMVRNSADHGLETPAERVKAGKSEQGTIRLSAYHEGGHIVVCIADDGRGLDTARIKAKAVANGLATDADIEKMTEAQIHKFIFAPGFSTAAAVTSVSGRGVGMDVVRTNIDQIGGTIDIKSVAGQGSSVTIKIPLTLAIISALIVEVAGDRFAIPQIAVLELVSARRGSEHRIERIKDSMVLRLRNRLLPLVHLSKLLGIDNDAVLNAEESFIVVTQVGNQTFGIVVDGLFHTEEIVVKPMCSKLRHIAIFAGNTILGDGAVIMIIDPNGLARSIGSMIATQDLVVQKEASASDDSAPTSLLVFRAGSLQQKAVPLALVTRLEEVESHRIEYSNGRCLIQYRDVLMPIVLMDGVELATVGKQALLVFADEHRAMGLAVDAIVDIVEEHLMIEVASGIGGSLGTSIIKGQATDVVDIAYFLPQAFSDWLERTEIQPAQRPQSLLLVDDSPFFRNMLAPVLKAAGYRVEVAANARDGLTILRSRTDIQTVITDIEMPEIDGYEFAKTIRADKDLMDMPIIALSAITSQAAIERGRQAGFHDYIAKFDRPGLIAALKHQTARSAA